MMRLALACLFLTTSIAAADDEKPPGDLTVGLGVDALEVFSTSGGVATTKATDQGTAYGVTLYAEYRITTHFSLGVAIPTRENAPGPTSNAYSVGIALRLRGDFPLTPWLRPFVAITPELGVAHLPQGVWWNGHAVQVAGGGRFDLTTAVSVIAWLGLDFTSYSGDLTPPPPDPQMATAGSVRTAYFGLGAGLEYRF